MFEFVLDFGTMLNIFMAILYLVMVIVFMFCRRGAFGLKREICLKSEELWHKVHVAASYCTMPFVLISLVLIFIKSFYFKIIVATILMVLLIIVWNLVVKVVTKKDVEELKRKEQEELNNQIKKESGWR